MSAVAESIPRRRSGLAKLISRHPTMLIGGLVLTLMALMALLAPWVWTSDPIALNPVNRLKPISDQFWFGTDMYGRDVYTRTVYGARISLIVGISAAVLSVFLGLIIGLIAGYYRILDAILMRVMDGLMAIPGILLAIAMVSLAGASLSIVVLAITIPEIPRVVRLVRSVVLSVREEPYVEAAIAAGTPVYKVLIRHVLPNTVPPLIVQATYVCASAMLTEAILSFLGAGTPPEIPSWGNMMSEGRIYFTLAPWIIFFPGIFLALTVLGVNVLGDGLRDTLDPRIAKRMNA